ncbi:MAG: hypothetical protein JSW64_16045 [Candidatus Zixiibacteriota bacterium]|nr:MAG: hypothetical protein JSW64_16045 [candidate division Zixibacteria bacterium]
MNKFRSILPWAIICLLILPAGCGKDDNPTNPGSNVPPELVGTWLWQSATANGIPIGLGWVFEWNPGTVAARFTVGSDGSLVHEELDADSVVVWSEWGTFTVDGNTATISITENDNGPVDPPWEMTGTWALNENQDELTLNTTYMGATVVLVAVKYQ